MVALLHLFFDGFFTPRSGCSILSLSVATVYGITSCVKGINGYWITSCQHYMDLWNNIASVDRCCHGALRRRSEGNKKREDFSQTWAIVVVGEGDLNRMAIVEDVDGGWGIVLQCERLQRCVVCSLARYNVNGRLARSICDREVFSPFGGSCNRKR